MKILYLEGDPCSPKYVAGALERAGHEVIRVVATDLEDREVGDHDAYLLSDYPAKRITGEAQTAITDAVAAGAGLVMVGGWTSYARGGWAGEPLSGVLPVRLAGTDVTGALQSDPVPEGTDDRVNVPSGLLLRPGEAHAITEGLPFDRPPVVTGYNRVEAREIARCIVEAAPIGSVRDEEIAFSDERVPIVLLSEHGDGRVVAITTDLAPHWSGGWTDWGERMIEVGEGEEVGEAYLTLLARILAWSANEPLPTDVREIVAQR